MLTKRFSTFMMCYMLCPMVAVSAAVFDMPPAGDDIVGESFVVKARSGDTLDDIADDYGIGYHEIIEANPDINPKNLRSGEKVIIPAAFVLPPIREGIVINLAEVRLYYFTEDGKKVYTYPVGLGRRDWRTPLADTHVISKKQNPTWFVPNTIRNFVFEQTGKWLPDYMPPGPENPLGPYAIYLKKSGYLIHGTNQPWSVGKLISSGCIRLYNQDIEELFNMVKNGTKVRIVHYPYKVGWQEGVMYLEAHEPVNIEDPINNLNILNVDNMINSALKDRHADIEWDQVDAAVRAQRGIPYAIGNFRQYNQHVELLNTHQNPYSEIKLTMEHRSVNNGSSDLTG